MSRSSLAKESRENSSKDTFDHYEKRKSFNSRHERQMKKKVVCVLLVPGKRKTFTCLFIGSEYFQLKCQPAFGRI